MNVKDPLSALTQVSAAFAPAQSGSLPVAAGQSGALTFDPDAWHAMQARDDQLIADSVLHGYTGAEFIYEFKIQGNTVRGISVVGARHLASQYGGIQARIVASVDKTGDLFVFKSFEPLAVQAAIIHELADQPDFYEVVMEVKDIKTGVALQVRKKELKTERRRDGTEYARPHYDVIAESKAFRNGVLAIIPQDVTRRFLERALKAGQVRQERTLAQRREDLLSYAAREGIPINREGIAQLTYAQLDGLSEAARGGRSSFTSALVALGLLEALPGQDAQGAPGNAERGHQEPPERQDQGGQPQGEPPQWPKQITDPETGEVGWVDSAGAYYDPERHGWSSRQQRPSITADGTFRARRGSGRSSATPAPTPPSGEDKGMRAEDARNGEIVDDDPFGAVE